MEPQVQGLEAVPAKLILRVSPPLPGLPPLPETQSELVCHENLDMMTLPQLGDLPPINIPVESEPTVEMPRCIMYDLFPEPKRRPTVWVATIGTMFPNGGLCEVITAVTGTKAEAINSAICTLTEEWDLLHDQTQDDMGDRFKKMNGYEIEDVDRENGEITIFEWLESYWSATPHPLVQINEHEID